MKTETGYLLAMVTITLVGLTGPASAQHPAARPINSKEVKCLVCKATMNEMESAVSKIDPRKKIDVGDYRLDATGDSKKRKTISYAKSEMYLTELMESVCDRMDDYAKARYKKSGRPTILKMMVDSGMNPEMSEVDFVQEGDLNKSLKHLCLEIVEDQEEAILKLFQQEDEIKDTDIKLCSEMANVCNDEPIEEDYEYEGDEDRDEL
ncbi:protein seele [Toxorhynchites rutilus septentrionalis]|uniref:protein seele n=1 Tax=Toxorhynchites rutilus septentrionalis TaxID=329112 RepID=UPI0024793475|nr:protein seele [Toxorhynchites rutilus septentrionalis]